MNIFYKRSKLYLCLFLIHTYLMNTEISSLLSAWQSFLWYILMNDYTILLIFKEIIQTNEMKYDFWL